MALYAHFIVWAKHSCTVAILLSTIVKVVRTAKAATVYRCSIVPYLALQPPADSPVSIA